MSPQDRELICLALNDLEALMGLAVNEVDGWMGSTSAIEISADMDALRARLAEPDDEPVACIQHFNGDKGRLFFIGDVDPPPNSGSYIEAVTWTLLYTRPAARKVQPLTVLEVFDAALSAELPRVSHVEYDSHEICKHFAGELRKRIAGITGDSHE